MPTLNLRKTLLLFSILFAPALIYGASYISSWDMGNIRVESNTISSTNTDGNIVLNPNGAGNIQLPDLGTSNVPYIDASGYLASSSVTPTELATVSGATGNLRGIAQTATLTNKTIDADDNTISDIDNNEIKASANIALNKLAATTASRALVSDGSGFVSASSVTATELGYVAGATSSIQTQLNSISTGSYVGAAYDLQNVGISVSVPANALTIALKQADGSTDPSSGVAAAKIGFRSTSLSSGSFSVVSATAATSITVPSGATLGCNSGSNCYIYVYAVNNAGTIQLGVNSIWLPDGRHDTSTIGTGSDTAISDVYVTTGATNLQIRMIARLYFATAPNGTYSSGPDEIVLGNAPSLKLIERRAATSSEFSGATGGYASGEWAQMTGNSITLQPGVWDLKGLISFGNSGSSPTYTSIFVRWATANGNNTTTGPTSVTCDMGYYDVFTNETPSSAQVPAAPCVITVTASTDIYMVPRASATTIGNARITSILGAERLQ